MKLPIPKRLIAFPLLLAGALACVLVLVPLDSIEHPLSHEEQGRENAIVEQSCLAVFNPPNHECPRFMTNQITSGAGFGHQFMELMFGMWAARLHGYSYVYEPFVHSTTARDDYSVMNEVLGLDKMFAQLGAVPRQSLDEMLAEASGWSTIQGIPVNAPRRCQTRLAIGGYYHCTTAETNDCFFAPENEFLFQRFAKCMRNTVQTYGTALKECILVEPYSKDSQKYERFLPSDTVVIVWHIRVGDVVTHDHTDQFYMRVLQTIKSITRGFRIRVILVGGGAAKDSAANTTASVPITYVKYISTIVGEIWAGSAAARVQAPAYTFLESFLAMMQADILVGSGSSLPQIAALLSSTPIFFSHVSKHGFHFGAELLADSVDMESNGTILDSGRRIRVEMFARMNNARGPCRDHMQFPT